MAKIRIVGDSSGYVELAAPNAAGNNTLELPSNATKLVGADASNSLNVTGIATFSGGIIGNITGNVNATGLSTFTSGINVGTGASISSPATNVLTLGTNSSERVRITSDGLIGINHENPTAGLSINKFGTQPAPSGNTYTYPAGNWSTVWNTTTANSTDYWCGFVGGYNVSSATVNISLSPNVFNFNTQAGIYIAGEATSTSAADFTIGKIIGGSVAGVSTVAGTQRATKSEMFRIDSSGRVTMPSQPAFMAYTNAGQTTYGNGAEFILNLTQTNVGNSYSTSTGRFTAPVSGFYSFSYGIYSYNTGQMSFKKNGSDYNAGGDALGLFTIPAANGIYGASIKLTLAANDTVSFGWRTGSSGDVYRAHGWFSGHLVG